MIFLFSSLLQICYQQFSQATSFNFPLQVDQPNFIYLKEYTPEVIKAPFYKIKNENNEYNLSIQQSVAPLSNFTIEGTSIQCGSNQLFDNQISTNYFWIFTNKNALFQGQITSNGTLEFLQIPITIPYDCYSINLVSINYGIMSCWNQTNLILLTIDILTFNITTYITNITVSIQGLSNYNSQIFLINDTYLIGITFVTSQSANYYQLKLSQQTLTTLQELVVYGNYVQLQFSKNFLYIFYLGEDFIEIRNNQLILIQTLNFPGSRFVSFYITTISDSIFRIVLLNNLVIETFLYDVQLNITTNIQNSFVLNPFQNLTYFQVFLNEIIMITNNYVAKIIIANINDNGLEYKSSLEIENYYNTSQISFSLFSLSKNIIIAFQNEVNNISGQVLQLTQQQIYISAEQIQTIAQNNYKLSIEITSQSLQQIYLEIALYLQLVNNQSCPILYSHDDNPLAMRYPNTININFNKVFIGPNLTNTITSNSSSLYTDTTSNYIKSQYKIPQSTLYMICAKYESSAIYCSQYKNTTVEISIWSPLSATSSILFNPNSTLYSCQCYKTLTENYVLMQFGNFSLIQQFTILGQPNNLYTFNSEQQILSTGISHNSYLVITSDNVLSVYQLSNNQTKILQISGQMLKKIYFNIEKYPQFIFIDNSTNLLIIYFVGQQYYEIVNSITYPSINYSSIAIGILDAGVYVALTISNLSYLYFYQEQSVYGNNQEYFSVDLLGYSFGNNTILSTYTQLHFFVILQNQFGQYCAFFESSGSSFGAFTYADQIVANNSNYVISQVSVVLSYSYQMEEVQLYTNNNLAINGTINFGKFQIVPYFLSNVSTYQANVTFSTTNLQCSNQTNKTVIISYDRSIVEPKEFNNQLQNFQVNNSAFFKIFPNQLFYGNIQTYQITGPNNISFQYNLPITQSNLTLNFNFQASEFYNGILYVQSNISLYTINQNSVKLVYNFPSTNPYCIILFIELLSEFPVSICYNTSTMIYAYNASSQQIISYNLSAYSNLYKAEYRNGILQLFTAVKKMSTSINYFACYFWIANGTINLQEIYNQTGVCSSCYLEYVYLDLAQNLSSQPCQVFGFTSSQKSGYYNPIFYLLKTCVPSNISIIFGFQSNNYTTPTNIYFKIVMWNLYQTLPIYFKFLSDILQIGDAVQKPHNIVEAQFSVPLSYTASIYSIQFNLSDGSILSFYKSSSLYLAHSSTCGIYTLFQGPQKMIVNLDCISTNIITASVYAILNQDSDELIQIVGYVNIQIPYRGSFAQMSDKYLLVTNSNITQTFLFSIQNYIDLQVDLTNVPSTQFMLTAYNNISSAQQYFFFLNEQYQQQQPEVTNKKKTILIASVSVIFVILVSIIFWMAYQKSKQLSNSQYLEMIPSNNVE